MNNVPDNYEFSLKDVQTVMLNVQGVSITSLQDAFQKAEDKYFNSDYAGSKDRLRSFRDYGQYGHKFIDANWCEDEEFGDTGLGSAWVKYDRDDEGDLTEDSIEEYYEHYTGTDGTGDLFEGTYSVSYDFPSEYDGICYDYQNGLRVSGSEQDCQYC